MHRRHRQVALAQRMRDARIGPAETPAIGDQERLQRADTRHGLNHTVFAQQRCRAPAVDTEHSPVRLLADVRTRVVTAPRTLRDLSEEGTGAGRVAQFDLVKFGRAGRLACSGPIGHIDHHAHEARFGLGQPVRVQFAARTLHLPHPAPVFAVVRQLDGVARRRSARAPVQRERAELARRAEVHTPAAGQHLRRGNGRRIGGQLAQREAVEAGAALAAATARGDHEFDGSAAAHRAVRRRAPGEFDLALAEIQRLPVGRKPVLRLPAPPHVLATRIDELELERVRQ